MLIVGHCDGRQIRAGEPIAGSRNSLELDASGSNVGEVLADPRYRPI